MTTQIQFMDRDEAVKQAREDAERPMKMAELESSIEDAKLEESNLDNEIAQLIQQLSKARQELRFSEATLAAIQESLAGKQSS